MLKTLVMGRINYLEVIMDEFGGQHTPSLSQNPNIPVEQLMTGIFNSFAGMELRIHSLCRLYMVADLNFPHQ